MSYTNLEVKRSQIKLNETLQSRIIFLKKLLRQTILGDIVFFRRACLIIFNFGGGSFCG